MLVVTYCCSNIDGNHSVPQPELLFVTVLLHFWPHPYSVCGVTWLLLVPCSWQQNDRAAVCLSSVDLGVDKCWEMGRENPSDFVLKMLADLASFSLFQVSFPYCKQNDTVGEYLLWERGFLLNHRVGHKTSILVAQHAGPMLHIGQATAEGCCLEIHNCIVAV